ncbi:hypothetical protein LINGRAPRIM_LOCUS69 [Linum grandiflorum]
MECTWARRLKGVVGVRRVWDAYRRGGLFSTSSQWKDSKDWATRHWCKKTGRKSSKHKKITCSTITSG